MIPTNDVIKSMALATMGKYNPGLVAELVGGVILTVASLIASILCGPAAPAIGIADGAVWASIVTGIAAIGAFGGMAMVVDAAEQMKNWPDPDKYAATFGFLPLTNTRHSLRDR